MISTIKQFVPLNLLLRIKYRRQFEEKRSLTEGKRPRIYYLDAPDYPNLGDQAIAVSLRQFAQREFPDYEFVEILQKDLPAYSKWLRDNIKRDDMIFLTGGGNMGNLYRIYEATRRYVVDTFKNNLIVIFPQSIKYTDDFLGKESFKKSINVFGKHKHLIVGTREKYSFEEARKAYQNNRVVLCPDIVFFLRHNVEETARKFIGVCLRSDNERLISDEEKSILISKIEQAETIKWITTMAADGEYTSANREAAVLDKLKEIAACKVLITDRLHAMIFAVLTNTPCVVIRNNNTKIAGTMEWLKENKRVLLLDKVSEVDKAIENVLHGEGKTDLDYSAFLNAIKE